jgi:hypothetical protein
MKVIDMFIIKNVLPPVMFAFLFVWAAIYGISLELCRNIDRYSLKEQIEMALSPAQCEALRPF